MELNGKDRKALTANIGLAKGVLACFVETFVQGLAYVLRMDFCAKIPPFLKP